MDLYHICEIIGHFFSRRSEAKAWLLRKGRRIWLRLLTPKRHYGSASGRFEQRLDCFNFIFDAGITLFNGVFNLVEVQDLQLPEVRLD